MPLEDGEETVIHYQHPLAMLHACCTDSQPFRDLMDATQRRSESTHEEPWSLILYNDEVGISPLNAHDARETQAVYWSIQEFGPENLCKEHGWFTIAAFQSDIAECVPGKMSQVCARLLGCLFV